MNDSRGEFSTRARSRNTWSVLLGLARPDLLRLGLVVAGVCGLTLALGMLYAVQRELDLAAWARATYDTQSVVELGIDDVDRVRQDLGSDAFLLAEGYGPLSTDNGSVTVHNISFIYTSTPETSEIGWFSPETRVEGPAEVGEAWIDLSSDLARQLGASLGDTVRDIDGVGLRVRSINAIRMEFPEVAQVPASLTLPTLDADITYQTVLLARGPEDRVRKVLADDFYTSRLRAGGYLDDAGSIDAEIAEPREERYQYMQEYTETSLTLVIVVSILAAAGGLIFIVREVLVFISSSALTIVLLNDIGVSARRSGSILAISGSIVVGVALVSGGLLASLAYHGLLAPVVPPALVPVWWGAIAAVALVGIAVVAAHPVSRGRLPTKGLS